MAKTKNKKRNFSETINAKKKLQNSKTLNPFEVHINKEKMKVLGRKLKNDRGLPGVSRAKALKKRKNTILQEYSVQSKSNKFTDKRIGEKNFNMSEEDRAIARFAAERVKAHKKKSIFNLADDEVLTHKGQTLSEIEKFDDPRSDDEDSLDENKTGKLESSFVEDAHFGGGVLTRTNKDGAKTHKELIDQLIAESKKRKAEKQMLKEATLVLTEKLDTEWKDLLPLVNKNKKTAEDDMQAKKTKVDDYDKVVKELRFEARGTPSDRLKTDDEIAKEEKEKLEKLEEERLNRMKGIIDNKINKQTHRSADDLDDNYIHESDIEEDMLSYNDKGESNVKIQAKMNGRSITASVENESENSNAEEENENEEQVEEDDSDEENEEQAEKEDSDEENVEQSKQEDSEEGESEDNLSDLKEESSDNDEDEIKENESNTKKTSDTSKDFKQELLERKEMMEKARQELPYTFSLPDSYENLQKILEQQSACHQSVIIERMIKCNHPSLAEKNKENLGMLFVYLMQHLNDISTDIDNETSIKNCFEIFRNLLPQLYNLACLNPENSQQSMVEIIKEKQHEYRNSYKKYPDLDVLIFLELVSCLFSTSDFKHAVVTPCFVFMEQMLNKCKILNRKDIAYGLFIVTLILEYTKLSKRFLPAAINYLAGILHMAVPKSGVRLVKIIPPFKSTCNHLVLLNEYKEECKSLKLNCIDLLETEITDEFKVRAVFTAFGLLTEFQQSFKEFSSNVEIFETVLQLLYLIPKEKYPEIVQNKLNNLISNLETSKNERKLKYIVKEKERPKALRLYEPKIETIYDYKKHKIQSREKAERAKLSHKLKRERKGALREIRRDKEFISRIKINKRVQSDKERKEKVNKLYAEAAMQQSELKSFDRQKKK